MTDTTTVEAGEPETETDYSVCAHTCDGKHRPAAGHDRDMPVGYLTIECQACGQTTGYPLPPLDDIDWG